ncbi:I78 family peptidase inhibitor [Paracoccus saliphilus]|nr:I78 family peptidase inhibitor [Paracoccus saliphilus]
MMRGPLILSLMSGLALAACEPVPESSTPELDLPQNCGAEELQDLVGQPKSVLDSKDFPAGTRIIGPGDAVTADYRADRLNIEINRDDRIEKIGCF